MSSTFQKDLVAFNGMYKMPCNKFPTLDIGMPVLQRLIDFKSILSKELSEIDAIIRKVELYRAGSVMGSTAIEILTDLADLLGDLQVYCGSEMTKFGLPVDAVLGIIMESNFSKMGADGVPIYDAENKLQKGPSYWKPEPKITVLLEKMLDHQKGLSDACSLLATSDNKRAETDAAWQTIKADIPQV